jgi:hypothetical protein
VIIDIHRIKRRLMADKRKLGMLTTLAAIGLLLWGRLLLQQVPRTATADPDAAAGAEATTLPSGSMGGGGTAERATSPSRQTVAVRLHDEVARDLFRFNSIYYPPLPESEEKDGGEAKSPADQVDESTRADAKMLEVRLAAQNLKLQSTLNGNEPRALINGVLLSPGEQIEGFVLRQVDGRKAVLEKEGVEIVLEM